MIPITYRLDSAAEKEYIDKVISCMDHPDIYSHRLETFLRSTGTIGSDFLKLSKRFKSDYPNTCCLCNWLVMPYEEMETIKKYLDRMIDKDLKLLTNGIHSISKDLKEIKSYHSLRARRKLTYSKHPTAKTILSKPVNYDKIYDNYTDFVGYYHKFSQKEYGINYWIIEKTGAKVCPYCNILYTYSRNNRVTAQLDHFFPASEYPIFALCFYNLIPSCPACNRIKSDDTEEMASPYKLRAFEDLHITWDYRHSGGEERDTESDGLRALEEKIDIKIETPVRAERHNLCKMKISEAYEQHKDYASEMIKKIKTYTNPETQKLICSIGESVGITPDEVERFYLGNYLDEADMKKRSLAKMARDFYLEIARAREEGETQ